MEPIYDRSGHVVGWIHQDRVLDRSNQYRAFVSGESVYSMRGTFLGRFRDGFFRDPSGAAVAFVRGATGGPILPVTQTPPVEPVPPPPPVHPAVPVPPVAPIDTQQWGTQWEDFLEA